MIETAPGPRTPGPDAPLIDAREPQTVRRAADLWLLVVSLTVLALAVLLALATRAFARSVQEGLLSAASSLPPGLRDALVGAVQVVAVLAPAATVVVWALRRRAALVVRVVASAALGVLVAWALTHTALARSRPDLWPSVLVGRGALVPAGWPSAVYLAGCAAAVVAARPWLGQRQRRALGWLTLGCALLSVVAAASVPLDAITALAVGATAGSAVLLTAGGPADRPTGEAVADALLACGIPVAALHERAEDEQSPGEGVRYRAETTDGARLAVRVISSEDQNRDLFHRLARMTLLRHPADQGAQTPLGAAEHELLMLVFATRTGARVDEPVIAYPVEHGGALLVTIDRDGRPLAELTDEELTDQVLADPWRSVARLQEHRLGHRSLRPEHVLVGPDGRSRLIALARAQLNASPEVLGTDIAELLATTAVRVGPERAVQAAATGLGTELLATALPYLQPLALMGPSRREVARYDQARADKLRAESGHGARRRTLRAGGRPSLLHDLAEQTQTATGAPATPTAHLARFTWKSVFGLVGAFLVLHLLLPQLAHLPAVLHALRHANWWWIAAVVPVTFLAQAFSTFLQQGTIPDRLPFVPTYLVRFAGTFLNLITPGNVGGMALNLRFLQKAGIETGAATASIGLQSLAVAAADTVVTAGFFTAAGQHHGGTHVHLPAGHAFLWVAAVLVVAGVVAVSTPPGRRMLKEKIWPFLRSAGSTFAGLATQPGKIALGVIGALGQTLIQVVGLALCLHAFGVDLPFVQLGAAYMAARLVAAAAPVPGGLGAFEAATIASLTALGVPAGAATSAVLVFRLMTFWLNLPLGAAAMGYVRRRSYV